MKKNGPTDVLATNITQDMKARDRFNQLYLSNLRRRILAASAPFGPESNISKHLSPGDLEAMQSRLEYLFTEVLETLQIDVKDPNCVDTPKRLAKMYIKDQFAGRYEAQPDVTSFPRLEEHNADLILIEGPIRFQSMCAHHWMPVVGHITIGVLFGEGRVIGLSKYARLAQWIARRPTLQETLTTQIADALEEAIKPAGLCVNVKAEHLCMSHRGVKLHEARTVTQQLRGVFRTEQSVRQEVMHLMTQAITG